jgi:hypothetical protein
MRRCATWKCGWAGRLAVRDLPTPDPVPEVDVVLQCRPRSWYSVLQPRMADRAVVCPCSSVSRQLSLIDQLAAARRTSKWTVTLSASAISASRVKLAPA